MSVDFNITNISRSTLPVNFKIRAQQLLKKTEKVASQKFAAVNLVFVSPKKISELNSVYRHKDKVTDVLSFNYENKKLIAGEIFICTQQARQQAREWGVSFQHELEFLFVHGCLHLLGYDHIKIKDKKIMMALEFRVLGRQRLE